MTNIKKIAKIFDFRISIKWLLIPIAAALVFWGYSSFFKANDPAIAAEIMNQIKATNDLDVQVKLYENLIDKIGPEDAQNELFRSGMPFTGQTHLLNHTVGDYLYEKYGSEGLKLCKDYFLSSCFHGFILNAIATGGIPEVEKTFKACLPSGPAVFIQCAHAIGHGFLANDGYKNLLQALTDCDNISKNIPEFTLYNCYDGIFMENIWAVHDGQPSPDRWVKDNDPVYPCNDKRIDDKYLLGCWSNQPALMYQMFRGDIAKVSQECDKVTKKEFKEMCFNGLSRQIHPLTQGSTDAVFQLCDILPGTWKNYCIVSNALSYFNVGDRELPFIICSQADSSTKNQCYGGLISSIKYNTYNKREEGLGLCAKIPDEEWKNNCTRFQYQ